MEHPIAHYLAVIAGPMGNMGDPKRATVLLAASEKQLELIGASTQPADKLEVDQFKEAIREQLGETEFNKAWDEGQKMTLEQAIAIAMEQRA